MFLLLFLISAAWGYNSEITVICAISEHTPSDKVTALESLSSQQSFNVKVVSMPALTVSDISQSFFIVDLTYSFIYTKTLSDRAQDYSIPVISLYKNSLSHQGQKYYFHMPSPSASNAIISFLQYFDWKDFTVFASNDLISQECVTQISNVMGENMSNFFFISENMGQDELSNMIGKMVKTTSTRKFVIISSAYVANMVITGLTEKKIYVDGTGVLVYGESLALMNYLGIIGIIEQSYEEIASASDYIVIPILALFDYILNNIPPNPSLGVTSQKIEKYFDDRNTIAKFSIVNVNNGERNIVGSITSTIEITGEIVYPGGATSLSDSKTQIYFSYAGGSTNPPPIAPSTYNPVQMNGAVFSTMVANNDTSILPNFNFSMIYTNCGVFTDNKTYINECLDQSSNLGVGFLSTAWSSSTVPYLNYFYPRPIVSIDTTLGLSNETMYPTFTRVVSSSSYWAFVIANFINVNGWKKIVVLTSDAPKLIALYNAFLGYADIFGFEIMNDVDHRIIGLNYDRSHFDLEKETFQHCADTGARIYAFLCSVPDQFYIVEGLYDIGLRRGDVQIISQAITGANIFASETPENAAKREELMMGSLGCYTAEWIGDYGKEMEQLLIEFFGSFTSFKCVSFDQAMLMMRSIGNLVNNGYDYEDPALLNKYLRQTRFTGCSGSVSIGQGTNDRSNQAALLLNLFTKNETWVEQPAVIFDPASQTPFEITQTVVWCDGTSNVPNDYRFSLNCPFDETKAKTSSEGLKVLYIICFLIAVVTSAVSIWMLRVFPKDNYEELNSKKIITAQDMAVYAMIVIEIFQYISLGTTPSDSSSVISTLSEVFGLNFKNFLSVTDRVYWTMISGMIISLWIWVILCITIICRNRNFPCFRSDKLNFIDFISEYLMPLIGDIGFIPIISVLMNLYVCNLTIEGGLTKSYNEHDCGQFCWVGRHLTMVIISLFSLAVYIPLHLYLRPLWQNFQSTINIKTYSKHMVFKSIFQIFVIVLSKTLAYSNKYAFGFLYSAALLIYGVFLIRFPAYNYKIANLWLVASMFIAFFGEVIYSISISTAINGASVLGTLIAGWIAILGVTYFLQSKRCVSYLYTEPSKDIPEIFKDVFRKNKFKYKVECDNEKGSIEKK